jgi:hypothetical protein
MSGTYTSNKNLNKPEHGGDIGTWGTGALNNNSTIIDSSLGSVTSISLTGLTTYTLSTADCQNATIKFTGNLADQVVTVLMTTGVSGQFAFIDSTTALGASSTISLGWTASGVTSYVLTPGKTQIVNADGVARVWARSASPSTGGVTSIPLSRWVTAVLTLTPKDLENSVFYIYGTTATAGTYPITIEVSATVLVTLFPGLPPTPVTQSVSFPGYRIIVGTAGVIEGIISPISVSPNPANASITVNGITAGMKVSEILFTNVEGKTIETRNIDASSNLTFDTSELNSGIYFIHVAHANGVEIVKFLKN